MLTVLRSRLALFTLLIVLLGLLFTVGFFTQRFAADTRGVKERQLDRNAQAMANQVEALFRRGGKSNELTQMVDFASRLLGAQIIIVNPHGQIVLDSHRKTPFASGSWHPLDQNALREEKSHRDALRSQNLVLFQKPIRGTRGGNAGAVLLVARVTDVSPDTASIVRVIMIGLATALGVWLLIGFYLTFSIFRPLNRIRQATVQIGQGNYEVQVPVQGPAEISRLATTFNTMARQVRQTNAVLKDFVANVSHDLRTPLTMIAGFSQAIIDGTATDREVESSAGIIHEEALKMQSLVDDLLQLTRLESGLFTLDRHPTGVRQFVQAVVDRVSRSRQPGSAARIENEVPGRLPEMEVDVERLERALRNLLDNAVQYTPPAGTVTVGARAIGRGWIEISVVDNGRGISRENLARVFERFYRGDRARDRTTGHSGLGLAIVREIVEAHGGRVSVESELGQGTVFRFTVPQAGRAKPGAEIASAGEPAQRPVGP